jgi:hypothetical protein
MEDQFKPPSIEFTRQLKAFHKVERDLVAQAYRAARRQNPEVARLLFRRVQETKARIKADLATALFSDLS